MNGGNRNNAMQLATVNVHFSARVLFMQIVPVKPRSHKFISHIALYITIHETVRRIDKNYVNYVSRGSVLINFHTHKNNNYDALLHMFYTYMYMYAS